MDVVLLRTYHLCRKVKLPNSLESAPFWTRTKNLLIKSHRFVVAGMRRPAKMRANARSGTILRGGELVEAC